MRERKDRGKRIDNGKWVEGYLFKSWEKVYILWGTTNNIPNMDRVHPESVGQFTGIEGKFKDDIVYGYNQKYKIVYCNRHAKFQLEFIYDKPMDEPGLRITHQDLPTDGNFLKVIGNTTDNPELLT